MPYRGTKAQLCALLVSLAVAACGTDAPATADGTGSIAQETGAAAGHDAPPNDLAAGTPAGGLEEWVRDIQEGVAALPQRIASDPAGARSTAVNLYVTRQEYIELYYGAGARMASEPHLQLAVEQAEARFHELMQLLGQVPPPGPEAVEASVNALTDRLDAVLQEARARGVAMNPRRAAEDAR